MCNQFGLWPEETGTENGRDSPHPSRRLVPHHRSCDPVADTDFYYFLDVNCSCMLKLHVVVLAIYIAGSLVIELVFPRDLGQIYLFALLMTSRIFFWNLTLLGKRKWCDFFLSSISLSQCECAPRWTVKLRLSSFFKLNKI